jgi:hypothetical protein
MLKSRLRYCSNAASGTTRYSGPELVTADSWKQCWRFIHIMNAPALYLPDVSHADLGQTKQSPVHQRHTAVELQHVVAVFSISSSDLACQSMV